MLITESGKERWPVSVSVAVRLEYHAPFHDKEGPGPEHFVLVSKRHTSLLGLVAGGLKKGETEKDALWREIREETGFLPELIRISDIYPRLRIIPHENYSSVGIVFDGHFLGDLPPEGLAVESGEVSLVRPYSFAALARLVVDSPERFFKPEFNVVLIRDWLREYIEFKYGPFEGEVLVKSLLRSFGLLQN